MLHLFWFSIGFQQGWRYFFSSEVLRPSSCVCSRYEILKINFMRINNNVILIFRWKGLGSRASRDLVEGIARAGNGTALFASNEEGLNYEVMEQLRDALHPSWTSKFWFKFKLTILNFNICYVIRCTNRMGRLQERRCDDDAHHIFPFCHLRTKSLSAHWAIVAPSSNSRNGIVHFEYLYLVIYHHVCVYIR